MHALAAVLRQAQDERKRGETTPFATASNAGIWNGFDGCWIPDLGHRGKGGNALKSCPDFGTTPRWTPAPAARPLFEFQDDAWALSHYVRSLFGDPVACRSR